MGTGLGGPEDCYELSRVVDCWLQDTDTVPDHVALIKLSVVGEYAILFIPGLAGRPQGVE